MTMSLVSTVTVPLAGAASIDFTGIPQTGQDLLVVLSGRGATTANLLRFNGVTTGYSSKYLYGTGSAVGSISDNPFLTSCTTSHTANTFGNSEAYIPNYTSTVAKSLSIQGNAENNATSTTMGIQAGFSSVTSAITSVSIVPVSGSFVEYSTASLYTISTTGATGATVA